MISYECAADSVDEYVCIRESTALECLKRFSIAVVKHFGEEYLRAPKDADMEFLLQRGLSIGFQACWDRLTVANGIGRTS